MKINLRKAKTNIERRAALEAVMTEEKRAKVMDPIVVTVYHILFILSNLTLVFGALWVGAGKEERALVNASTDLIRVPLRFFGDVVMKVSQFAVDILQKEVPAWITCTFICGVIAMLLPGVVCLTIRIIAKWAIKPYHFPTDMTISGCFEATRECLLKANHYSRRSIHIDIIAVVAPVMIYEIWILVRLQNKASFDVVGILCFCGMLYLIFFLFSLLSMHLAMKHESGSAMSLLELRSSEYYS